MKICCTCKESKTVDEFGSLHSTKDGLSKRCKPCSRIAIAKSNIRHPETKKRANRSEKAKERWKIWMKANPEKSREYSKKYRTENKELIREKNKNSPVAKAHRKEYYIRNKEKKAAYQAEWQRVNKDSVNERNRAYRARHPEKAREYHKKRMESNPEAKRILSRAWAKANPGKVNADTAKRRAKKSKATPLWGNDFFIKEAYSLSKLRESLTGIKWNVDHIVPIRSPYVCGLHDEHNLQVITANENQKKCNKRWPDMWEYA